MDAGCGGESYYLGTARVLRGFAQPVPASLSCVVPPASLPSAKPKLDKKREDSLKRALLDLYRDLKLLQNFAIVNYTAVVKVCVCVVYLSVLIRHTPNVFPADTMASRLCWVVMRSQ